MKEYYKERAPVYDRVYSYSERQKDLRKLERYIPDQFRARDVIEVAAGTGYWTQFICKAANEVLSTDITPEALMQIPDRVGGAKNITTKVVSAYALDEPKKYTGAFAGLWFSHIPLNEIDDFYKSLHRCLVPGATVVFIDNSAAQCERLPLSYTDIEGNTYQDRKLDSGKVHRVLKNFPTEAQLIKSAESYGKNFIFRQLENYWLFQYTST